MKKTIFILTILLSASLITISCSDDKTTGPSDTKNYFPQSIGSWWVFDNYELDQSGNRIEESIAEDSVAITGKEVILGKETYIYSDFYLGNEFDKTNRFVENNSYWVHNSLIEPDLGDLGIEFPLDFTDDWVKIADPSMTNWSILTQEIKDLVIEIEGITVTINGNVAIFVDKGSTKNITVDSKSISSQEFVVNYKFTGTFTAVIPIPQTLNFTVKTHFWFGEDAGLISGITDPVSIDLVVEKVEINGSETIAKRFSIVK